MQKMMTRLRDKVKNKRGFTLIELIVVVAIIAILIALLVPNVVRFIETANRTAANANAKTVYVAAQTYLTDLYSKQQNLPTGKTLGLNNIKDFLSDAAVESGEAVIILNDDRDSVVSVSWHKPGNTNVIGHYPLEEDKD